MSYERPIIIFCAGLTLGALIIFMIFRGETTPAPANNSSTTGTPNSVTLPQNAPSLAPANKPVVKPKSVPPTSPTSSPKVVPPSPATGSFVHILSPNGGEQFCYGNNAKIEWSVQGTNLMDRVSLVVRDRYTVDSEYPLGSYRATTTGTSIAGKGSIFWKVGETKGIPLPSGKNYEIVARTLDGFNVLIDTSDKVFSVGSCR